MPPNTTIIFAKLLSPSRRFGALTMLFRLHRIFFFCVIFSSSHAQLLSYEDHPPLIDRLLQVVWEPSSLIRWWTALDQMYQITLGWKRAARTVASLPFREGRSMDSHIRIKEPRHMPGRSSALPRKSDIPHWDRFNKVYSESLLPPSAKFASNSMHLPQLQDYALPPPFLFHPQEVFADFKMAGLNMADAVNYEMFRPKDHVAATSSNHFKKIPGRFNEGVLMPKRGIYPKEHAAGMVPLMFFNPNAASNGNPQEKLRMFLILMKKLGEAHANSVNFDDDVKEEGLLKKS